MLTKQDLIDNAYNDFCAGYRDLLARKISMLEYNQAVHALNLAAYGADDPRVKNFYANFAFQSTANQ